MNEFGGGARLTEADIVGRVWNFGLTDGGLFARNVVLGGDGLVLHYDSPNEQCWRIENGQVVLVAGDGTPSCRMRRVPSPDPARLWLEGEHILHDSKGIYLALRETGVCYPVHVRWSKAIEDYIASVPFYLSADYTVGGVFKYGDVVTIPARVEIEPEAALPSGFFVSMGAYSYCHGPFRSSTASIGRYCSIAGGAHAFGPSHPLQRVSTSMVSYSPRYIDVAKSFGCGDYEIVPYDQTGEPVHIENDVWIGEDVLISGGVTVGNGAVLAARTVVTKDVPPYAVVAGVPGRVIKSRFLPDVVEMLMTTHWWDYNFCDLPRRWLDPPAFCAALLEMQKEGRIQPWRPTKIDLAEALIRIPPGI
jgi:acetyltransferase-like isoleucine patch superfamily enzyme